MTLAAVRINTVSARVLTPSIIVAFKSDAPIINGVAFIINCDRSVPKSANDDPKDTIDAIPSMSSATLNAAIAPAKYPAPSSTLESTILTPIINGVALTMNFDRSNPICGSDDEIPSAIPPTILPINLPNALPINANVSPPSVINSLKPGI